MSVGLAHTQLNWFLISCFLLSEKCSDWLIYLRCWLPSDKTESFRPIQIQISIMIQLSMAKRPKKAYLAMLSRWEKCYYPAVNQSNTKQS